MIIISRKCFTHTHTRLNVFVFVCISTLLAIRHSLHHVFRHRFLRFNHFRLAFVIAHATRVYFCDGIGVDHGVRYDICCGIIYEEASGKLLLFASLHVNVNVNVIYVFIFVVVVTVVVSEGSFVTPLVHSCR